MHATVPPPAPSSGSHSSGSVSSPPPSFTAFQALMDQSMFFNHQNYHQEHAFATLQPNAFDGYARMAHLSPQDQQFPYSYNQSYCHNNSLLPSPNTSSPNLAENQQLAGVNVDSPVATTAALHMPTPPGESNDSICKLELASPAGDGTATLIPLTKVRDYNNVKEIHQRQTNENGTNLGQNMISLQQIGSNFSSQQAHVLQVNGMDTNCSLTFNLPITPPPNVSQKRCQCQFDCKGE